MIELFYLKIRIYDWLIEKATNRSRWWDRTIAHLSDIRNSNFRIDLRDEDSMENLQ